MATISDTATFLRYGTSADFEKILHHYEHALKLKAADKTKKPEELIKLDNWYQNELPKKIKSRGKDCHLTHEELVQTMKWKQTRGKYYSQLNYLIKVNTPRAVVQETKRAFKKMPNIEQAITALSNLKGVGTTMASALLAAVSPEIAPFMADECLMSIPEIESIDYTAKEYLNFVQHMQNVATRLNQEIQSTIWSPHRVELAIWTHYVISKLQPDFLSEGSPDTNESSSSEFISNNKVSTNGKQLIVESNGDLLGVSDESNQGVPTTIAQDAVAGAAAAAEAEAETVANGKSSNAISSMLAAVADDDTTSTTEDSLDKAPVTSEAVAAATESGTDTLTPIVSNDETNDSVASFENNVTSSDSTAGCAVVATVAAAAAAAAASEAATTTVASATVTTTTPTTNNFPVKRSLVVAAVDSGDDSNGPLIAADNGHSLDSQLLTSCKKFKASDETSNSSCSNSTKAKIHSFHVPNPPSPIPPPPPPPRATSLLPIP